MNQASYFRPMPGRAVDLRHNGEPWERRAEFGAGLRQATPLASHAGWAPPKNRPSPLVTLSALDEGRKVTAHAAFGLGALWNAVYAFDVIRR